MMKNLMIGIVIGLIAGLLVGYHMGSRWTQKLTDKLRAEFVANHSTTDESKAVNMSTAIDQVREVAQRKGVQLSELKASGMRTVKFRIVDGPMVSLQWRDMGEETALCTRDLEFKFARLMETMKRAGQVSTTIRNVDMTK